MNPLLNVQTNADLEAQAASQQSQLEPAMPQEVVDDIAAYVRRCFDTADTARQSTGLSDRLIEALRAKRGEYSPEKLAAIASMDGSDVYSRITATKSRAAASWLRDALFAKERPWTLQPSPEPEMPGDMVAEAAQRLHEELTKAAMLVAMMKNQYQQMVAKGYQGPAPQMPEPPTASQIALRHEEIMQEIRDEQMRAAKRKAERAETKVDDVLQEGGFYRALDEFIDDIATFPFAVLKGPVMRRRNVLRWQRGADGKMSPVTEEEIRYEFERVSPFDFYPSPMASSVENSWTIERHRLRRADLVALKGVPGYADDQIDAVLEAYGRGGTNHWLTEDSARDTLEGKNSWHDESDPLIDALEFYGSLQGSMLLSWGMSPEAVPDPNGEYPCNVWVIGSYCIKAVLNPDPLGRKPYGVTSWERVPGSMVGIGLADMLRDVQDVGSACLRALVNNMGIASGPQVMVNLDRLSPSTDASTMYPWKRWHVEEGDMGAPSGQPPVAFFQPGSNAEQLIGIYRNMLDIADDWSSIPKYMQGSTNVGTLGRTASGLSMIMNSANKGMTQVLSNIDRYVIKPVIEYLYYYLMRYDEDESFKGDLQIVARGASGILLREAQQQRVLEFMQLTANPLDMQIVGPKGRKELLRSVAGFLDLDVDAILPKGEPLQPPPGEQGGAPSPQGEPGMVAAGTPPIQSGQALADGTPTTDNFSPVA